MDINIDDIDIKNADIKDLEQIYNIECICFPSKEAAEYSSIADRLRVFKDCFLVAVYNGEIIGFINGATISKRYIEDDMFSDTSFHNPDNGYQAVFGLDVLPEYRNRGVAGKLLSTFIEAAKLRNKRAVVLTCKEHLLGYYKSFGFENLGISNSEHGNAVWYDCILEFDR